MVGEWGSKEGTGLLQAPALTAKHVPSEPEVSCFQPRSPPACLSNSPTKSLPPVPRYSFLLCSTTDSQNAPVPAWVSQEGSWLPSVPSLTRALAALPPTLSQMHAAQIVFPSASSVRSR
jgi:hypothetical protein